MDIRVYREKLVKQLEKVDSIIADMIGSVAPKTAKALKQLRGELGGEVPKTRKRRKMSAAARKAIGDAQRLRWAKQKAKK